MDFMKLDIQLFSYYDGDVVVKVKAETKEFEQGLNKIQNTTKSAGGTIKNIVAGLGITKLIGAAMSAINNSLDDAVSRFDTLNNFPKVMSNLNISAEDSQKSIDKMSDALMGLPTTLDQGAMAVQRFTSKNSDVGKSTDLFLALNNAILAGGASSEIQSSALEQLSQAYAKGKPDMMEWRTAMMAMPAQLKQVALAMGYVNADALGEALRKGEVSMDDFMNKIVELNTKGANGFKSFDEQARNATDGIKTAITNMHSRVAQGTAAIIEALNIKMENLGLGKLSDFIANTGTKIKDALKVVAGLIEGTITASDFGKSVGNLITKTLKQLADHLPKFLDAGIKAIIEFAKGISETSSVAISNFVDLITNLLNTIIDNLDLFIEAAVDIVLAIAEGILNNSDKIISAAVDLITKLITKLTDADTMNKLAQAGGKIVIALASSMIKNAPQVLTASAKIKGTIINELGKIPEKMISVGANIIIGLWQGLKSQMGSVANKLQSWASNLVTKVKKTLKIASPSKVFRDEVGKMMAAGIEVGFGDEIKHVYNSMQRAIDLETSKMNASVQTSGTYQVAMSGMPTINLKDNSTNQTQLIVSGRVLADVVNTENRNREVAKA